MRHPLRENLEITDASGTDTICCSRCRFQYCRADQDCTALTRCVASSTDPDTQAACRATRVDWLAARLKAAHDHHRRWGAALA